MGLTFHVASKKQTNQIHYGKDADVLLRKLYEERKNALASAGIIITLERLLEMYGYVA